MSRFGSPGKTARPLTAEQAERGRSKEARLKSGRTRQAKNTLTWLRRQVQQSTLPEEVRARIDKLFAALGSPATLASRDEETALQEAHRIAAQIHWIRCTHKMLSMDPQEPGFMMVSKAAAQWTLIDAKLKRQKEKGDNRQLGRKRVPTARPSRDEPKADEPADEGSGNGETA